MTLALLLAGCPSPGGDKANGDDRDGDGLTATDCDDTDASVGEASVWFPDADGDGHGADAGAIATCERPEGYVTSHDDCDDTSADRYPGNPEACDGVDNNCNDLVDEADPGLLAGSAVQLYPDADGDGFGDDTLARLGCTPGLHDALQGGDCDDTDPAVSPAAPEACNGRDDDCDGLIDDADPDAVGTDWYVDEDGDGYGHDDTRTSSCAAPAGAVAVGGDCNDSDPAFHPGARESDCTDPNDYNCDGSTGYDDADGDGSPACEDCNDADPATSPDADEFCNGVDDDCDGSTDEADALDAAIWYADTDGDGFGDPATTATGCSAPLGHVADATDCDDGDATIFPGAPERCNEVDDDCNGIVDDPDALTTVTWYADTDGDGFGDPTVTTDSCSPPAGYAAADTDCDDTDARVNPGAEETCNGVDDDCDGAVDEADAADATTWYADADGDGFGDAGAATTACTAPAGYGADGTDCDDTDAAVNPDGTESCNGLDDDCDGVVDESSAVDALTWYVDADADGYGDPGSPIPGCSAPLGAVADATDCDDTDAAVNPTANEYCNGYDDDCDGDTDEADAVDALTWYFDADGDTWGDPAAAELACTQPTRSVENARDCDDTDPLVSPDGTETCNGADDDCNGSIDDNPTDPSAWYEDADLDGYGDSLASAVWSCDAPADHVADHSDCDDSDDAVNPGATEDCDTLDNDCDGRRDESGCACDVEEYGGHLYQYCTTLSTWSAARASCLDDGYDLVAIGSAAENTEVVSQAVSRSASYWWMGFNDASVEGTWVWSNGEATAYTAWAPGEPNDSGRKGEDCGQLYRFADTTWNDASCTTKLAFVCEE
jgi:hypothetical protein